MKLDDLPTPVALVDSDRLENNVRRMADRAQRLGVRLRPHIKTHKSIDAARIQTRGQFGGITVSTLAEVSTFADGGFEDIIYAVPAPPRRLDECARFARRIRSFHILVDHPLTFAAVERAAVSQGIRFSAYLKVDCGLHRAGVDPNSDDAMALASALNNSQHVDFRGLLTHAGHSYRCRGREEVAMVAAVERDVVVGFAKRLRDARIEVNEISIGSTPTMTVIDSLPGITEIRPGNYIFFDAFQAAIGSCGLDDIAFSVLTTVIGVYPQRHQLVVDAGALALSKDAGPIHISPDCGFGIVTTVADQSPIEGLMVTSLTQEHAVLSSARGLDPAWRPGTQFRILPNHSCLSAACFDRYHVVRGTEIIGEWPTIRGW